MSDRSESANAISPRRYSGADEFAFEDFKQLAHLVAQVFASEHRERRLSIFITNYLTHFSRNVSQDD
jgi:hypothetical protein